MALCLYEGQLLLITTVSICACDRKSECCLCSWYEGQGESFISILCRHCIYFHANKTRWNGVSTKRDDCLFMRLQMSPKQQLRSSSPHGAAGFSFATGRTQILNCFYDITLQMNWNQSLDIPCAAAGRCIVMFCSSMSSMINWVSDQLFDHKINK